MYQAKLEGHRKGVPFRGSRGGSGKHLARCRRFVDDGVPSGVVRGGEFRKAPSKVQEVVLLGSPLG